MNICVYRRSVTNKYFFSAERICVTAWRSLMIQMLQEQWRSAPSKTETTAKRLRFGEATRHQIDSIEEQE